jgi:FixJ family two-component response regulator
MNYIPTQSQRPPSGPPNSETVFVVDGDIAVCEMLSEFILESQRQVVSASTAEAFLGRGTLDVPCCILVELNLSGISSFELQDSLSGQSHIPFVFMSRHVDLEATVRAMKAGALEFLTKPIQKDLVLSAISEALEWSRAALGQMTRSAALHERYQHVSPREREVMRKVVTGSLNKQIGFDLGISEITVKAHRGNVMRKMQAGSLAELVGMVAALRKTEPSDFPDVTFLRFQTPVRAHYDATPCLPM